MNLHLNKSMVLDTITYIKAIAIIMVVILHNQLINLNEIISIINNKFLTPFRMPSFMFVSGFLFCFITLKKNNSFWKFLSNKFTVLIIPFFSIKLLHVLVRLIKHLFIGTDFYYLDSNSFKLFITDILFYPIHNQVGYHLWFVYVLFLVFMIGYLLSHEIVLLVFTGLVLYFIRMPDFLGLNYIQNYLIFFALGAYIAKHYKDFYINSFTVGLFFSFSVLITFLIIRLGINNRIFVLMENLFGIIAVTSLALLFTTKNNYLLDKIKVIGNNSYSIYFLHPYLNQFLYELITPGFFNRIGIVQYLLIFLVVFFTITISITFNYILINRFPISAFLLFGKKS